MPIHNTGSCCPACGGTGHQLDEQVSGYLLRVCCDCDLVFSDPMRAAESDYYQQDVAYKAPNLANVSLLSQAAKSAWNEQLLSMLPKDARVLDIGCGFGAFVRLALDRGHDAYGIDFNHVSIEAGRQYLRLDDRLSTRDLQELNGRNDGSLFDLITLFEVIEHVAAPAILIKNIVQLLRPGGLVALSCPNEDRIQPTGRIFVDFPPHHLTRWRPATLVRFLENHGLKHIRMEVDCSLRDLVWVAYVNWQSRRKAVQRPSEASTLSRRGDLKPDSLNRKRIKVFIDRTFRAACGPVDYLMRRQRLGTMGLRVVAQKL